MKFKLILIILLSFSLTACAEKEPQSKASDDDGPSWVREKVCENRAKMEYPFDFKYIFKNEVKNSPQFSREITEEERDQFYNFARDYIDDMITLGEKERFNRKRTEPKFTPAEKYQNEQKIKILLDECVALVGPSNKDKMYRLNLQEGVFARSTTHSNDKEFFFRTEPHYLTGRMQKCESAIYPYPKSYTIQNGAPCASPYDFADFEYQNPTLDPQTKAKRAMLEKKYEIIYLNIRAAGLLRAIGDTYYPKTFLREHADQIGLTKYIQIEEKKAGHKLKHDELAKEYFGSYEKWVTSLDKFLDQKTIQMKIGTK